MLIIADFIFHRQLPWRCNHQNIIHPTFEGTASHLLGSLSNFGSGQTDQQDKQDHQRHYIKIQGAALPTPTESVPSVSRSPILGASQARVSAPLSGCYKVGSKAGTVFSPSIECHVAMEIYFDTRNTSDTVDDCSNSGEYGLVQYCNMSWLEMLQNDIKTIEGTRFNPKSNRETWIVCWELSWCRRLEDERLAFWGKRALVSKTIQAISSDISDYYIIILLPLSGTC